MTARPDRHQGEPLLGATGLVAGREVRQRMRGRAFRVATVLLLLAVAAGIVLPTLSSGSSGAQRIGIVGTLTSAARSAVRTAVRASGVTAHVRGEKNIAAARADLRSGHIDVAVIDARTVVVHQALSGDDSSATAKLARALAATLGTARAVAAARLTSRQAAALATAAPLTIVGLRAAPSNNVAVGAAITGLVLMFVLLTQYLTWTLTGVMQEKTNRVVEVLLATMRPIQLLTGKLLGIGAVVLTQASLIVAFALVLGKAVGSDALHGAAPLTLLALLSWLIIGYAFYSWLYATAGSMVERQDQVQTLALPLVLPMLLGYLVGITALSSGQSSTLVEVLAYLPPTAPFAMPVLVALHAVTWWQFTASLVIAVVSTLAIARVAATVYRRAILRTGSRVRLRDVLGRAPTGSSLS